MELNALLFHALTAAVTIGVSYGSVRAIVAAQGREIEEQRKANDAAHRRVDELLSRVIVLEQASNHHRERLEESLRRVEAQLGALTGRIDALHADLTRRP